MIKKAILASMLTLAIAGAGTAVVAVGSDGFTKSDMSTWFKDTPKTEITQPLDGKDGIGVAAAEVNADGKLIVTLTDGRVIDCGRVVGVNGENGKDGVGVEAAEVNADGNLIVTLTDGSVIYCGKVVGENGKDGINGENGADGVGVETVEKNAAGELVITLTDGRVVNCGKIDGENGKDGVNGTDGKDGIDGANGQDGVGVETVEKNAAGELVITLTDGRVVNCGKIDGENGKDGVNGTDGKDGIDGVNGADGVGVETAEVNAEGKLIITLTDGSEIDCGKITLCEHDYIDSECTICGNVCAHKLYIQGVCVNCGYKHTNHTYESGVCTICDYTCVHTVVTAETTPATCIETGLTEGSSCSICGVVLKAQEVVPALGHNYENKICTRCGDRLPSEGLQYAYGPTNGTGYTYATVTGLGSCTDTDIVIPKTVEYGGYTLPVTTVLNCKDNSSITSVIIPEGVTKISNSAFSGCTSLKGVTIPNSATEISSGVFANCPIENATIPVSAFQYIKNENLKTLNITNGIKPFGILTLGSSAFKDCTSLVDVTISFNLNTISDSAFKGCTSLTHVTFPESLKEIGRQVFEGCTSLTDIVIPESVTVIGDFAFNQCESLTSIVIPNGVTEIGECVFQLCGNLTSVTIPESVTSIGAKIFNSCTSLTEVHYSGTEEQWNALTNGLTLNNKYTNAYTVYFGGE